MIQNRTFFNNAQIVFAEMNSLRIIGGISNIQACNPIQIVALNAIINPKKA
jgi:hypothetical protein